PPNGNTPAPINVSALAQDKLGVLTVGGLGVFGPTLITSTAGYVLPTSLSLGVNGKVGATAYCDEKGNNCVTTLGGASAISVSNPGGGSKPSRASLVRARGVNLPPPAGMSDWPDTIMCTFAPGEDYIFDFYGTSGSGSAVAYWTQDKIGTYFNPDGTFNTGQNLRGDPKCGSKANNIKDFCAEGRCIY
ncbi:MAG: hypothetical protein V4509_02130, partial [Patescibacteria group bacterium]